MNVLLPVLSQDGFEPYRLVVAGGELDMLTVPALLTDLNAAAGMSAPERVILDLSAVTFADVSFLSALCPASYRAARRGGWLRIVYLHASVARLLRAAQLTQQFPQYLMVGDAAHDHPARAGHPSVASVSGAPGGAPAS